VVVEGVGKKVLAVEEVDKEVLVAEEEVKGEEAVTNPALVQAVIASAQTPSADIKNLIWPVNAVLIVSVLNVGQRWSESNNKEKKMESKGKQIINTLTEEVEHEDEFETLLS
jgi:hypothetical protein